MQHSDDPLKRPYEAPKINDHVLASLVTIALVCLLSIVIPLAAILPPRYVDKLPINIVVPLYTSPAEGAWDAIYSGIIKHDDLNFTVIISPDNGTGLPSYPPDEYISAVKKLDVFPNVQTIGYIDSRKDSTVLKEIETYASWTKTSGLSMYGIFFDRTPFEDTAENNEYLRNISAAVKHADGIQWPRLVVHNPGVVPNANLSSTFVDVTIVFDGQYKDVEERKDMKKRLAKFPGNRANYGMVIHSLPEKIRRGGLRKLINSVKQNVKYMFITTLDEKYGKGFGSRWSDFLSLTW